MATEAQVSANRRNARKSTGPKTEIGKAVVAQNAIRHGLYARRHVVMGEDPAEFELSRNKWLDEFRPMGNEETLLAERVAGLAWRLRRAERLQNELFDFLLTWEIHDSLADVPSELSEQDVERIRRNPRTDPSLAVGRMLRRDYAGDRALEHLMTGERRIESSLFKSLKELRLLQHARKAACNGPAGGFHSEGGLAGTVNHGRDAHATQTHCGVTTNGKQSQSVGGLESGAA